MTTLEKENVKTIIREVLHEDKAFLREIVQDFLRQAVSAEKPSNEPELSRDERVDAIIRRDFERYQAVFKALA